VRLFFFTVDDQPLSDKVQTLQSNVNILEVEKAQLQGTIKALKTQVINGKHFSTASFHSSFCGLISFIYVKSGWNLFFFFWQVFRFSSAKLLLIPLEKEFAF
jgi:hypothetical protein